MKSNKTEVLSVDELIENGYVKVGGKSYCEYWKKDEEVVKVPTELGYCMNTQDYIDSIKQKNLEKAKWVLKMRFGDDLNKLKDFYANRPSESSWADLKTVIEVLESENNE